MHGARNVAQNNDTNETQSEKATTAAFVAMRNEGVVGAHGILCVGTRVGGIKPAGLRPNKKYSKGS